MTELLRIDTARIMHETIDGEVVIVNLDSGTYYSLDDVGTHVWEQLADGRTLEALVSDVAARYRGEPDRIASGIETFIRQLREENLIAAVPAAAVVDSEIAPPVTPTLAYTEPTLKKYTDMEQLLLVDPIHEVEESGWPNVK